MIECVFLKKLLLLLWRIECNGVKAPTRVPRAVPLTQGSGSGHGEEIHLWHVSEVRPQDWMTGLLCEGRAAEVSRISLWFRI